jgi:hypothetical protein
MSKTRMGRASIFRGKMNGKGKRVQAVLTPDAGRTFEDQRRALGIIVLEVTGAKPTTISDSDTVEFLTRGPASTRIYLREKMKA